MALDGGAVYTILGGRFNPSAFREYDAANKQAVASATAAEAQMANAAGRGAKAQEQMASATGRSARASEDAAKSHRRLGESLPLAAMNNWGKQSDQASKNLSKLGGVAAKAAGIGLLAVGAGAVYAAAKATTFNREMLKLQTQAGASAAEVEKLKGQVLGLAGQVPQGPQQLAEGLYHLQSAGFRGAQSMELLKAAAEGAALGNSNLESTTQAMISVIASQIGGVHGAADAMGQLNDIVGVGDVRMEDLAKAMGTSGLLPVAAHFGLQLKDVGAMIATTTDNATPAAVTLTRLRMAISLLGASSPKATKELATIGIGSKQLAEDMRKPDGGIVAIEDLNRHLKDSGKNATEQAQLVSKAFGGGRSSAGITLLLDEIGRLQSKYHQLGTEDGPKKLAESWAAFQKSQSASFGELKSAAEGFAITVGNVLLPSLTKLAHEGAKGLQQFVSSGEAAHLGTGLQHGFETLVGAAGDLAPILLSVAKGFISVGQAIGLGNSGELAALAAAFLAFRGVTFVAPMLAAIGAAMAEVGVAAATAPSIGAFAADIVAMAGPVGLIAGGLALAAGAFVAFKAGLFDSTSAAEKNAAALERDADAVKGLQSATEGAAKSSIAAQRADLARKEAGEHLKQVEHEIADGALKGAAAQDALKSAQLGVKEATLSASDAHRLRRTELDKETVSAEKAKDVATRRQAEIFKEIELTNKQLTAAKQTAAGRKEVGALEQKLAGQQKEYNERGREAAQVIAQINTAEVSRRRIEAGRSAITAKNAQGVEHLQNQLALANVPQKVITKYELDDQNAQAKLGNLLARLQGVPAAVVTRVLTNAPSASAAIAGFNAILHGVPAAKVIHILHNAHSSAEAMHQLTGAVNAVPASHHVQVNTNAGQAADEVRGITGAVLAIPSSKTIHITTITTGVKGGVQAGHASGRSTGSTETALVGEGGGPEFVIDSKTGAMTRVSEPTFMGLSPEDYVIPTEDRYRGRALGLMALLAREWGVPGFKGGKGKGKAKHHYTIPNAVPPLSLPLSEIEQKRDAVKSDEGTLQTKVKSEATKVASLEKSIRTSSRTKKPDRAKLNELHHELAKAKHAHTVDAAKLAKDKTDLQEWNRTLREAKAFDQQIKRTEKDAENARAQMKLAADHDDPTAYNTAKTRRLGALHQLQDLLKRASAVIAKLHPGSQGALDREGELLSAQEDLLSTEGEGLEPTRTKAQEEEERTGETEAERVEQAAIKKRIALAALTPDLADDKAAAQELVGFLERVLGETLAEPSVRGGDESVTAIAESLKNARSNLTSLTGGGGTNENADVQAQIEQQKARAEAAEATVRVQEGVISAFGGPGDIGAGGANARGAAAGVTQNIYTLHPADPATLTAIGAAATAGISYQGGRQATRINVGP
jgi:TP901 family phage tail tape measure protein